MFFIRKDKNLSCQRELTKSSIQSIRTGKWSNETSTSLSVSSVGCFYSLSLLNMRNAGRGVDTAWERIRFTECTSSGSVSAFLGEWEPRLECAGIVGCFNWRSHSRSGVVNRAGIWQWVTVVRCHVALWEHTEAFLHFFTVYN